MRVDVFELLLAESDGVELLVASIKIFYLLFYQTF